MARICLVAHFAYGAMTGGQGGHVGGVERQTSLLARWLAGRGHEVSLATWDEGSPADEHVDGVRIIKICRRDAGLPGLRFFHPRWTGLCRALSAAGADIYYQNCAEYVTGQVALWCRRHGRRFVYSVASEPDCDRRLPKMRTRRERVLYRYGLRHADRVIVQTEAQRRMLWADFGVAATRIPMPCPGPSDAEYAAPEPPAGGGRPVAWVGRIAPVKRMELLLDIAQDLPGTAFELAGPPDAPDAYVRPLLDRARALPNVTLLGRLSREAMAGLYRRAAALLCTSAYEGLPNTFLEAFSHGVPVVSTVDPDDIIRTGGLGATASTRSDLVGALGSLLRNPERWRAASTAARRHYLDHHTLEVIMPNVEGLLLDGTAPAPPTAWTAR